MKRVVLIEMGTKEKGSLILEDQTRTRLAIIASLRVTSRRIVESGKRNILMMMGGLRRILVMSRLAM